ncbi:MAG: ribonuclease HI [Oscillatoriales cyanobacterium]|nr:MAG: ribonuclease HI [Oscillatoriales cyanobacterium]
MPISGLTTPTCSISRIYTDGACSGNPGPGGWGVVVRFTNGQQHELGSYEAATTNNRMEMQAAIAALEFWHQHGQGEAFTLLSDSQYVIKGITEWVRGWQRRGWKTASGQPVLNRDLWERLDALNSPAVQWQYVRGHSGEPGNERCDTIARGFATGRSPKLDRLKQDVGSSLPEPGWTQPELTAEQASTASQTTVSIAAIPETMSDHLLDATGSGATENDSRDVRVGQLHNLIETLRIADEVAAKGYLIASSELADLMDVNASAVTSRGENWVWRNWIVTRVRREGNQILWQLERILDEA